MTAEGATLTAGPGPITEPGTSVRISRFTRTERAVHWVQAISFLTLLITGFALMLPAIESVLGHRELLREIHLTGGFFLFFGPAIVAVAGDRASLARDVRAIDTWDRDDFRWLIPFPIARLMGISTPPQGRFNAGQKLNAIFVVWSTILFSVTGLVLWQNRRFSGDLVTQSNTIHTALAYIALAAFLGHLFLATGYPKTRHAFRAITQGWVNRDWAEHHHLKWVRSVGTAATTPAYDAVRTIAQLILGSAGVLFFSRVLFFRLGANPTDKVTGRLYDITAWPGTASLHPQTGAQLNDWIGIGYMVLCLVAWIAVDRLRKLSPR